MSAHGTRSRYSRGCRCAECRDANRAYIETRRRAQGVQPLRTGPQTPHGTATRYKRGCRCDDCCEAIREALARQRASRKARLADAPHGTISGYVNWSCRCDDCRRAGAGGWAKYAAKRRAGADR